MKGQEHLWHSLAAAMSGVTLRAFGTLLAVFPAAVARPGWLTPKLIALEEPEKALHPAAAAVLLGE